MDNSVLEAQQKRIDQLFRVYGGLRDELTALQRCLVDKGVVREMELLVHLHKHRFAAARQASPVPLGVDAKQLFDNLNLISSTLSNGDLASTRDLRATSQSIQKAVNNASPKLYAIGGVAVTGALNSAERYDPWRNQWETLPTMNFRRAMHTSAVIAGHLCICGGGAPGSPIGRTMMHFKPGSGKWGTLPQMTTPRTSLASAVVRERLYVCGGMLQGKDAYIGPPRKDDVILRSAECFDPAGNGGEGAWEVLPDMISSRCFHSAVNLEGQLLVCGGEPRLNSVERFDTINNKWAPMSPMLAPRNSFVAATVQGKVYVAGGSVISNGHWSFTNSVECFDPASNSWTAVQPMHTHRHGPSAAVIAERLYVLGGQMFPPFSRPIVAERSMECFDPKSGEWESLPSMVKGREFASSCA
eukprot:gnl/TRDRNA2_/TRDRNA2_173963_c0_seq5.p1 gnl/TRDRNA2_/TRDRNA2_173963_c0~~gnl/TRDRNA2_/TRDRNA2_173963_c0_seq5.p1  ORF type:complete len:414 (+),score=29.95 gnl/TRDRNA2_/TRDRNA2_173963_c0_seq5:52-1293(+)